MAHKRNRTHNSFTVQTLKHYETKRLKEHYEKNTTGTIERDKRQNTWTTQTKWLAMSVSISQLENLRNTWSCYKR